MKRREFLKTACLATTCILPACKSTMQYDSAKHVGDRLVVDKSLFTTKNVITIAHPPASIGIVKLGEDKFSASLLVCSHRGCEVTANPDGFICPCHGARFDLLGQVTKGPAEENLTHFVTSTDQQSIYVHLP